MTPERWRQVKDICGAVLDQPPNYGSCPSTGCIAGRLAHYFPQAVEQPNSDLINVTIGSFDGQAARTRLF